MRAAKSPARKDSMADSNARENWSESGAIAVPTAPVIPSGAPDLVVSSMDTLSVVRESNSWSAGQGWLVDADAGAPSGAPRRRRDSPFATLPGVWSCYTRREPSPFLGEGKQE